MKLKKLKSNVLTMALIIVALGSGWKAQAGITQGHDIESVKLNGCNVVVKWKSFSCAFNDDFERYAYFTYEIFGTHLSFADGTSGTRDRSFGKLPDRYNTKFDDGNCSAGNATQRFTTNINIGSFKDGDTQLDGEWSFYLRTYPSGESSFTITEATTSFIKISKAKYAECVGGSPASTATPGSTPNPTATPSSTPSGGKIIGDGKVGKVSNGDKCADGLSGWLYSYGDGGDYTNGKFKCRPTACVPKNKLLKQKQVLTKNGPIAAACCAGTAADSNGKCKATNNPQGTPAPSATPNPQAPNPVASIKCTLKGSGEYVDAVFTWSKPAKATRYRVVVSGAAGSSDQFVDAPISVNRVAAGTKGAGTITVFSCNASACHPNAYVRPYTVDIKPVTGGAQYNTCQ